MRNSKLKYKVCILTRHPVFDTRIFHKEAKTLVKAGYNVTLIAPHSKNEEVSGIQIIARHKFNNRFGKMIVGSIEVLSLALKQKADIYHIHDPELLPIGAVLKIITKKAVIYDVHEHYPNDIMGKNWIPIGIRVLVKKLFEFQERLFLPFVSHVIYTTPLVGKRYNKMVGRKTSIENYPLKDTCKWSQSIPKKKEKKVLYLGLMEDVRGILELVEAMSIVVHQYRQEVQLYLIGPIIPISFQNEIQNLIQKRQIAKYVKLLPPVSFRKSRELLLESSIGVVTFLSYPNHLSCLPNKLFEYMAAGLPVIASDFPLYREVIQGADCGVLVKPEDPKEIALAINNLLLNPELRGKMGQNGKKAILTKYNWDSESSKLLEIYSNLLKRDKLKILNIVAARPNFMKIAPIVHEMRKYKNIEQILVHTGQHYDNSMSDIFFRNLGIPKPDIHLNVGSGSHAVQTARVMQRFEKVLLKEKPDLVVIVGDVNSTLACGLTACKLNIKVAHVESGLRSFDRSMPEEINRILTDHISDYLFTSCEEANENLLREGIDKNKIYFVGNIMIDSLLQNKGKVEKSNILSHIGLIQKKHSPIVKNEKSYGHSNTLKTAIPYSVLTLHRPANVDNKVVFQSLLESLTVIARKTPIIFPAHPRTKKQIARFKFEKYFKKNIIITEPLTYIDFLKLCSKAKFVLTDSGGIQEETTVLGIPCITLRENTERPITVNEGTNYLIGTDVDKMINITESILKGDVKKGKIPRYWDGKVAERIVSVLS